MHSSSHGGAELGFTPSLFYFKVHMITVSNISKAIMMSINRKGKSIIFKKQRPFWGREKAFPGWLQEVGQWHLVSRHYQKEGFDSTSIILKNLYFLPAALLHNMAGVSLDDINKNKILMYPGRKKSLSREMEWGTCMQVITHLSLLVFPGLGLCSKWLRLPGNLFLHNAVSRKRDKCPTRAILLTIPQAL